MIYLNWLKEIRLKKRARTNRIDFKFKGEKEATLEMLIGDEIFKEKREKRTRRYYQKYDQMHLSQLSMNFVSPHIVKCKLFTNCEL